MLRKITLFTIVTLVVFAGLTSCTEQNTDSIAIVVGDNVVTQERIHSALDRCNGDSLYIDATVTGIINRMLILQDAEVRGLNDTPAMERYRFEREREQLQNTWLAYILDERVSLSEDTVETFYENLGTNIIYTVMTVRDSSFCEELRQRVINGEDMSQLVKEHTVNQMDTMTGGLNGPTDTMRILDRHRHLVEGISEGEVSEVDTLPAGWVFIKVDSLFSYEVEPFEEVERFIENYIISHEREAYKVFLEDSLREANHLEVVTGLPELVAEHALDNIGNYEPYTSNEENSNAYTFDGGARTLLSLVENIRSLPSMMPRTPTDPEWVEGYCGILGLYDIMAMEGRKMQMDTLPEIVDFVENQCNDYLLDLYYEAVIQPRLEPTDAELMEAYQENTEMLVIPEKRSFLAIAAIGEQEAEIFAEIINAGERPFTAFHELTILESLIIEDDSINTVPQSMDDIPAPWDSMLFSMEIGEMVLCTLGVDRIIAFQLEFVNPERQATLEEAESELRTLITADREEEVVVLLVDSLREVYHIEVDREFVNNYVISEIEETDIIETVIEIEEDSIPIIETE